MIYWRIVLAQSPFFLGGGWADSGRMVHQYARFTEQYDSDFFFF